MKPLNSNEIKLCQMQAKLFEESVDKTDYSSAVFIRRFMFSDIACSFDDMTYLLRSDSNDAIFSSLIEQFGESSYGSTKFSKNQMFWIGYIYRCFSIINELSSKQTYRLIGANEIISYYNIYHTYDIVDAAQRIAENIGYKKEDNREKTIKYLKKLIVRDKLKELLNTEVTVYIDRPIGSSHPDYKNLKYELNYGYIKDIVASDNEYQDAYVLGISKPLKRFRGKVIGIVARKTDIEDKLLISGDNKEYTNEQIRKMIDFQEKHFKYRIIKNS